MKPLLAILLHVQQGSDSVLPPQDFTEATSLTSTALLSNLLICNSLYSMTAGILCTLPPQSETAKYMRRGHLRFSSLQNRASTALELVLSNGVI